MMHFRTSIDRRRLLKALGLGGAALALPGSAGWVARARANELPAPRRVVFWLTPHGTVWKYWNMNVAGLGSSTSRVSLATHPEAEWSPILAPLYAMRNKVTCVEGLARLVELEYERYMAGEDDTNRHHFAQAGLLTCVHPMQRAGTTCIGGGVSIDQVIGNATTAPGRWASRVYGWNHQHPYSFIEAGNAAPREQSAQQAFNDIMGVYVPPDDAGEGEPDPAQVRAQALRRARGSVLDFAAEEFRRTAPRLGRDDREKLERHADLIRDLEVSFQGDGPGMDPRAACEPTFVNEGHQMDRFAQVMTLALSCDLTRVVTFVTPPLNKGDFAPEAPGDIHQDWAHCSIERAGCYNDTAAMRMRDYNAFYAQHFARFLEQLDSVPEGDGTVLDHTAVVWLTELSTGYHDLDDFTAVIGGGGGGYLRTGQYVRFGRDTRIEERWATRDMGPGHNRLYVTLMRMMGLSDDGFGQTSVRNASNPVPLTGVLDELTV